ncbi:uncharacterized protein LOC106673759 [Cimex lectularius]|uniref:EGF-like domain-containing protein n=1 Tax=Cimex lectularius TaxID=79782 RepID=A0A8I6TLE6_CIMLE|nr:uncharacterized protein LOC106673759 [Cimex lectularius]
MNRSEVKTHRHHCLSLWLKWGDCNRFTDLRGRGSWKTPVSHSLQSAFNMLTRRVASSTLVVCFLVFLVCESCDPEQIVRGCMIQAGHCFCGKGCMSEFLYKNRNECKMALNGDSRDACKPNPCEHNGACLQTTRTFTNYKCRCEGTGYYGPKCQYACSKLNARAKSIPYECIEI